MLISVGGLAVRLSFSLAILGFLSALNPLFAHEIGENSDEAYGLPEELEDTKELAAQGLEAEQSVIDQFKVWESGQTLRGCFFSGQPAAKDFFVETVGVWESVISVSMDFGNKPSYNRCGVSGDYHLRVSLEPSGGNWSYIGTDSIRIDQSKPSLHIIVAEPFSLNNRRSLAGTILHELGHALALKHEHQSPEAKCADEINWPILYSEMALPPNNFNRKKVDDNFRPLVSSKRVRVSEYDPKSIMHYAMPPRWFIAGTAASCYIKKNTTLSELDKISARETYPASPQRQDDYLNQIHSSLALRLEESDAQESTVETLDSIINKIISIVPERNIGDSLGDKVVAIGSARTSGNCSPIITDSGDVSISC